MSTRKLIVLAGTMLLAGCMVGPDYERPTLDLPAAYPESSQDSAALPADWWALYGDATLNDLVATSLSRNADILLAVAKVDETEAALREANSAFVPEVDLGAGASNQRLSTVNAQPIPAGVPIQQKSYRIGASTSFELDFWGHLRRISEAARAQALGTRYARDVVVLTLAGTVTQTYFALRSLDAQIIVTQQTILTRKDSLDLARSRARGGLASDLDVYQAESAYAAATVLLKDFQRQRSVLEHQLGSLTGKLDLKIEPGDLLKLPTPPLPPAGLPSTLLERRPDVLQAEQNLVSANAQIGVAKSALFPTFTLTGSFGQQSAALADLFKNGASVWSLGLGAAMPIIDGGRYSFITQQAEARQHQALAIYQKAAETAFREVADALTNVQQATATEDDLLVALNASRNALRLSRLRYEAGYSAFLEVLDAQRTSNDAELLYIRNRQALLSGSVDLMKALGGGWSAEQLARKQ